MGEECLEDRSKDSPKNVDKEVRDFFSKDPLFGLYGVPDECGKNISDYEF